jgi:predicted nuclease of predicted toxin-antitoxin system
LRFLVDAQLPPALASWLRDRGHEADDVRDLGLEREPDSAVAASAANMEAVIVTKDADFSRLISATPGCRTVWIRLGNARSKALIDSLSAVFDEVEDALEGGQTLVEVSR